MEYEKLMRKTNDIITWLENNECHLDTVLRAIIKEAQVKGLTEAQYANYWSSVRTMCKTLPKGQSPIRKGFASDTPMEVQAIVDSVVTRVISAFAAIGDADLMLEVLMPSRVTKDFEGYANIQELAEYHVTRVRRYLLDAYPNRWDGKLTKNNLTGVQLPNKDTTESKEDSQ